MKKPNDIVLGSSEPKPMISENDPVLATLNQVEKMMVIDSLTYLPDDILVKVDRAGMGF